jgi:hypothetical protein
MSSEQLWVTGRPLLGVYFIVLAAVGLPSLLTPLGAQSIDVSPWLIPVIVVSQCGVYLLAGLWLLRSSPCSDAGGTAWPRETLIAVLQVIGLYFIVHGVADAAGEMTTLMLDGGYMTSMWGLGRLSEAAARLGAGLLLAIEPAAVAG